MGGPNESFTDFKYGRFLRREEQQRLFTNDVSKQRDGRRRERLGKRDGRCCLPSHLSLSIERTHSAVFFAISLTEKVRPNGSLEVDERVKLHIWTTFEQNLPMDPGDNPRNVPK